MGPGLKRIDAGGKGESSRSVDAFARRRNWWLIVLKSALLGVRTFAVDVSDAAPDGVGSGSIEHGDGEREGLPDCLVEK